MKNYNLCEIINNIRTEKPFFKSTEDGSLSVYVYNYIPLISLAIHSGEKLDRLYRFNLNLSEEEKNRKEEKYCNFFIADFPIKIIANESKLKYDLDKSLKQIIDHTLYKKKINDFQIKQLKSKHQEFYTILEALINKILRKHKSVYIYDIHSFDSNSYENLLKIEFNKGKHEKYWKKENERFMQISYKFENEFNKGLAISEDSYKLENSYLGNWLDETFPKRVHLTRINVKSTYFKNTFQRYDTYSLDKVRKIIKSLIFLRHKELFMPIEIKRKQMETY